MLPILISYDGVCYVLKIFLNLYSEHLECEVFIDVLPKPTKCQVLLLNIPSTNKLNM